MAASDRSHLRSFVCVLGHELRITRRCLTDDVNDSCDALFDELVARHGIIRAFKRERRSATSGTDTLGPSGGERPLTVLRHTNNWRGVTWFEEKAAVVWLCACARHRSGQPNDAFPRFESLREAGYIWPTDDDYEALAADRGEQFAAFVVTDAPRLLASARATRHRARARHRPRAGSNSRAGGRDPRRDLCCCFRSEPAPISFPIVACRPLSGPTFRRVATSTTPSNASTRPHTCGVLFVDRPWLGNSVHRSATRTHQTRRRRGWLGRLRVLQIKQPVVTRRMSS